jgi:thioredoxin 2
MAPWFAAAARSLAGTVLAGKLDTEAHGAAASKLGIRSIPTLILFAGGGERARTSGAMQAGDIVAWVGDRI